MLILLSRPSTLAATRRTPPPLLSRHGPPPPPPRAARSPPLPALILLHPRRHVPHAPLLSRRSSSSTPAATRHTPLPLLSRRGPPPPPPRAAHPPPLPARIYGVEPAEANVLNGGKPGPHLINGNGVGFKPDILDMDVMEKVLEVKGEDAVKMARELALKEGLLVGISSAANTVAALELAKKPENKGKLIVLRVTFAFAEEDQLPRKATTIS